tara:strand:+ start:2051 stop:3835 length:1785 start_codon:yes stop_codon:yes gene_type:complete
MASVKNYGLKGIGNDVQFGKRSGRLTYDTDHFNARNKTNNAYETIRALDPIHDADLATKLYVDSVAKGLIVKDAVKVATNSLTSVDSNVSGTPVDDMLNITYDSSADTWSHTSANISFDQQVVSNGDRVLIKDGTGNDRKGNGIFTYTSGTKTFTRSTDADNSGLVTSEIKGGVFVHVFSGAVWGGSGWTITSPTGTILLKSSNIIWSQFSGEAGVSASDGLTKLGNYLSVNADGVTIGIINDQVKVKSSSTQYQVLTSAGSGAGVWGAVQLDNANATTGLLPANRGGIGEDFSSYADGKIIVKGISGGLTKGSQYDVLQVGNTTLEYNKVSLVNSVTGTLPIANGGTGGTTSSGALTSLGAQPLDAQLTDIAGLTPADGKFIVGDGNNFVTESDDTARISLGVGTTDSPTFTGLTVSGTTAAFNGLTYTMPSVAGQAGQLLSNDGNAVLSWTDPASGPAGIITIPTNNNTNVATKWTVLHCNTTDATQTNLYLTGSATEISIATDTTMAFEAKVVARNKDADESFVFLLKGMAVNNAGTVTIYNQGVEIISEQDADWDATAIGAGGNLRFRVTGEASKDIQWAALVNTIGVTY